MNPVRDAGVTVPPAQPTSLSASENRNENLTAKAVHAAKWNYAATFATAVMQIGFSSVLARILRPADYGVLVMAMLFLRFGTYFSRMGIGQALEQRKELAEEDIRAGFTWSVALGVFFAALAWVAAPCATFFLQSAEVVPVVRALAIGFVLNGLAATGQALLRRKLDFKKLALIDVGSYGVGFGALAVPLALAGFGVWSLVLACLSQMACAALLTAFFSRHSWVPTSSWSPARQLMGYGGRVSVFTFLDFISVTLDNFFVGRWYGDQVLGLYSRCTGLVTTPAYSLTVTINRVMFPALSAVQDQRERMRRAYLDSLTLMSLIAFPIALGGVAAGPDLIAVMLGPQWVEGAFMLRIYAFVILFGMLGSLGGVVLDALSLLNPKLVLQMTTLVVACPLMWWAGQHGILFLLLTYAFMMVLRSCIFGIMGAGALKVTARQTMAAMWPGILYGLCVGGTVFVTGRLGFWCGPYIAFASEAASGMAVTLFFFAVATPQPLKPLLHRILTPFASTPGRVNYVSRLVTWYCRARLGGRGSPA